MSNRRIVELVGAVTLLLTPGITSASHAAVFTADVSLTSGVIREGPTGSASFLGDAFSLSMDTYFSVFTDLSAAES